jgi:hypothetical protein
MGTKNDKQNEKPVIIDTQGEEIQNRPMTLQEICRKYSAYSPPYVDRSWPEMIDAGLA